MIDIKNFQSNLLKIDKKPYEDIDIYFIGYITMKKFNDCEHIHSVNPLYLIINSATKFFSLYIKMNNTTYYQRNRDVIINKKKDYYKNNKEKLREQARGKYRNLSEEEKI